MKTYQITINPLAPWSTPWHADTLFAALACQMAQRLGNTALRRMIEAFLDGSPPFVISDGFPEGWFPCPLSVSLKRLPSLKIKAKLPSWIEEGQFQNLIIQPGPILPQEPWPTLVAFSRTLHASIDRSSGTTGGAGNLFEVGAWHAPRNRTSGEITGRLAVFFRTADPPERIQGLFEALGTQGLGKKRSAGHGAFEVIGSPKPCEWMDRAEGADGFVSLSHFVSATGDPTNGRWSLIVKYPKFGDQAPVHSPFKGRIAMLEPGSVFQVTGKLLPFYGTVIEKLNPDFPEAVHYALAFPVPIKWPEDIEP